MKTTKNGNIKMSEKEFQNIIEKVTNSVYKTILEKQIKELAIKMAALEDSNPESIEEIEVKVTTTHNDS